MLNCKRMNSVYSWVEIKPIKFSFNFNFFFLIIDYCNKYSQMITLELQNFSWRFFSRELYVPTPIILFGSLLFISMILHAMFIRFEKTSISFFRYKKKCFLENQGLEWNGLLYSVSKIAELTNSYSYGGNRYNAS